MPNNKGLMLIEAVASVVIVSISLALIAQSLLTNMRTGRNFVEQSRFVFAMENQLGQVLAITSSGVNNMAGPMTAPYKDLTSRIDSFPLEKSLSRLELAVWATKASRALQISSIVYAPKQE